MPYVITMHTAITDEAGSEYAVATTWAEAARAARDAAHSRNAWIDPHALTTMPEQGGTFDLPGSVVIKVERTSWAELEV